MTRYHVGLVNDTQAGTGRASTTTERLIRQGMRVAVLGVARLGSASPTDRSTYRDVAPGFWIDAPARGAILLSDDPEAMR